MINGFSRYDFVTGGIVAVVSILMVFLILVLIIFLTELVAKAMGNDEKEEETKVEAPVAAPVVSHLDLDTIRRYCSFNGKKKRRCSILEDCRVYRFKWTS